MWPKPILIDYGPWFGPFIQLIVVKKNILLQKFLQTSKSVKKQGLNTA